MKTSFFWRSLSCAILTPILVLLFSSCNTPAGKPQANGKVPSYYIPSGAQLDSAFTEIYPLKGVEGILDTNVVVVGDGPEKQAQYQASLAKLDGLVAKINRRVKKYDQQPVYWVEIDKSGFYRMLLEVNNIPLAYAYTGQSEFRIDLLNPYIETCGEQALRIRAYSSRGNFFRGDDIKPTVRIGYSPDKRQGDAEPQYLTDYITLPDSILDTGTQYWDTTITFQAQVPWDYSDRLARATDLRTLPNLEEQVLKKYEQLRQNFIDCDVAAHLTEDQSGLTRYFSSIYKTSYSEIESEVSALYLDFAPNYEEKSVSPVENYELALYKNGRIAHLRKQVDKWGVVRGTVFEPDADEKPYTYVYNYMLYLPEGATELQVY